MLKHLFGQGCLRAGADFGFHIGPEDTGLKTVVSRRANSYVKSDIYDLSYKTDMI